MYHWKIYRLFILVMVVGAKPTRFELPRSWSLISILYSIFSWASVRLPNLSKKTHHSTNSPSLTRSILSFLRWFLFLDFIFVFSHLVLFVCFFLSIANPISPSKNPELELFSSCFGFICLSFIQTFHRTRRDQCTSSVIHIERDNEWFK